MVGRYKNLNEIEENLNFIFKADAHDGGFPARAAAQPPLGASPAKTAGPRLAHHSLRPVHVAVCTGAGAVVFVKVENYAKASERILFIVRGEYRSCEVEKLDSISGRQKRARENKGLKS